MKVFQKILILFLIVCTTSCAQEATFSEDVMIYIQNNGIGLAGKLDQLNKFFAQLKSILKPNGQILLDSSDILYMFDEDEDGGHWIPDNTNYYGEVSFVIAYKGKKSDAFDWLYLDYNTLQRAAIANNLNCELIEEGEHFDYLAKLSLNSQ
jgi:hypothetical protein